MRKLCRVSDGVAGGALQQRDAYRKFHHHRIVQAGLPNLPTFD